MAKLQTEIIALADYASLSREKKLTIAGIFDRIFIGKLPGKWPKMFLVLVFKGRPRTKHNLELTINSKTGKKNILKKRLEIKLGENGKANLITGLIDFPLKWPGEYRISVREAGDEVGYFVFSVTQTGRGDVKKKDTVDPN